MFIIDDRTSGSLVASTGTSWRLVTDRVMGGVSSGDLRPETVDGQPCLRLTGKVRLENEGGFVQMALDLLPHGYLDARKYSGVLLDVRGNTEGYNLHVRTADVSRPWQAYRATFQARPSWHTVRVPFSKLAPYRISAPLDLSRLRRIGLVAIGRAFFADLCVSRVALYRDPERSE